MKANFKIPQQNIKASFLPSKNSYTASFSIGGGGVSSDYLLLFNKPLINGVELVGDKNSLELGLASYEQGLLADSALQPKDNISELVNNVGYITGITSSDIQTALGYIPYSAENPSGFITISALNGYATENWVGQQGYLTSSDLSGYATEQWVNNQGFIKGINNTDVITALGYTPYDNSNPAGYITSADLPTLQDLTTQAQMDAINSGATSTNIGQIATNTQAISTEATNRQNADNNLQSQIDAITASSDVTDIVGTYAQLQAYDTSTLAPNSIIKVLQDEHQNNETTYYRWVITGGVGAWVLIGEEGPYYTKSEADGRFVNQATTVNNKALSSNINLTASDVGALPDNTVIGDGTLTIQKNGTTIDTFTANTTSNKTINITVPTDTQDLTNDAGYITNSALNGYATENFVLNQGYITGITSTDVTTALGYVPYNSTNPSGYTTNVGTVTSVNNTQPDANGNVTLTIPDTATWGNITGTLSDQTDLQTALNAKQDVLTSANAGNCIEIAMGGALGLPAEYQEVKYLQSSGTQYIDTGVVLDDTMTIRIKYDFIRAGFVFGSRNGMSDRYSGMTNEIGNVFKIRYGSKIIYEQNPPPSGTVDVVISPNGVTLNGVDVSSTAYGNNFYSGNCYLFTINNGGTPSLGEYAITRVRRFTIDNVIDLVPCKRKSDNVLGMYDLVNDEFLTNAGTGIFLTGENVEEVTKINFVNDAGYISGITSSDVTTALGYTPYNSTNPDGYITSSALNGYATETWVNNQGFLISSDLAPYVTSTNLTTILADYALTADVPTKTSDLTNDSGYITGISSGDVTTALGYTPVNPSSLATVATSGSYNDLSNKPTIPTVNNGTLTIQKNGTTVGTFTANDTNNIIANISVPTSISNLTDDTSTNPIDKAESVADQRDSSSLKYWTGTKAQYDAIVTKDSDTIYNVEDTTSPIVDILNTLYPIGAIYIGTMATCPLSVLGVGTWQLVAQDRVLQGAGTRGAVGTTINESLPNIKGYLHIVGLDSGYTATGAFSSTTTISNPYAGHSSKTTQIPDINFKASDSSSTYQDNAPVQQDGYLVNIWERTA